MIGIYFLFQDTTLNYIGATKNWPLRLKYHISQEMPFNKTKFIECPEEKLFKLERAYILKYKPPMNVNKGRKDTYYKPRHEYFAKAFYRKSKNMKLRKLTEKSIVGFGKFLYTQVSALRPMQVASLYFNCSHINFFDDVLERAGITNEWRIEKPGLGDFHAFGTTIHPKEWNDYVATKNGVRQYFKKVRLKKMERTYNSKSQNQRANLWRQGSSKS